MPLYYSRVLEQLVFAETWQNVVILMLDEKSQVDDVVFFENQKLNAVDSLV